MAGKRSEVSQIILRNTTDDSGKWTDMHISLGSWVTIRPSQRGKFAVKKRKLNDLAAHWKAHVVGFVLREGGRCVDELVIEHAYGPQDMMTQGIANSPSFPKLDANCICSSEFKDKTPAQSVTSVLEVHHHVVGSLLYPNVALSFVRDRGVWFHKYHYTIPSGNIGKLALVDAPTLLTLSSGISDMHIVSAYRCLLTRELGKAMTERGGVRGGLKAFIPLSVFAFMFKEVRTLKVIPQTYTFRNVSGASLNQIFLGEWGKRIHEMAGQLTSAK